MTICYWGGCHSAKKHLQNLMQINGKKFCLLYDNNIIVEENIIYWHGYLNREDHKKGLNRYWDNDSHTTVLYRDGDELLSVSRRRRLWGPEASRKFARLKCDIGYDNEGLKIKNASYPPHALIEHSMHRGVILRETKGNLRDGPSLKRKVPMNMSEEYAERYKNDPKLKNTWVHHEAVKRSKISKMMTIDDIPDCHLLIPQVFLITDLQKYLKKFEDNTNKFYSQDWNRYRNIVPYKSNLVDSARNFLDLFPSKDLLDYTQKGTSWKERWDYSVFDVYETDKKTLWKYLDESIFTEFESVPKKLKQYGIKFEYFDLDKDSYKKTFEIDKDPLFRLGGYNLMDQLKNFPTKEVRDRYHRLTNIAKEYVAQCGREDNRITL